MSQLFVYWWIIFHLNRQQEVLCAAVACLDIFIQNNFVGPYVDPPEYLQVTSESEIN